MEDGSEAQWFVDGQAAFEAIALAIEKAKSEVFFSRFFLFLCFKCIILCLNFFASKDVYVDLWM